MYDGDRATLAMKHYLREEREMDTKVYSCTVIEYKKETEQVHLLMSDGELTDISLDAIYECRIKTIKGEAVCSGMIKERYENRAGMILILQIANGFYEINVK